MPLANIYLSLTLLVLVYHLAKHACPPDSFVFPPIETGWWRPSAARCLAGTNDGKNKGWPARFRRTRCIREENAIGWWELALVEGNGFDQVRWRAAASGEVEFSIGWRREAALTNS